MAQKWSTVRVVVTEYDRFSGQKEINHLEFDTDQEADDFVTEHNSKNNLSSVPEYYTVARKINS